LGPRGYLGGTDQLLRLDAHDAQPGRLDLLDSAAHGISEGWSLTIEIAVDVAIAPAERGVVTAGLEESVEDGSTKFCHSGDHQGETVRCLSG
jgi:hypothetical protein